MPCSRGGLLLGEVPGPGGGGAWWRPPGPGTPRTATAACGTHSTGMHSCLVLIRTFSVCE